MKLTKDEVLDIATTAVLRNRQLAGENEGLRIQIAKLKKQLASADKIIARMAAEINELRGGEE
ncbi:MAG: hypothetical protein IIY21_10935 [Clostridiales bacterium]|nr:hypothetical protein [Clostridiales bacterium]MBQ1571177.1 hypothetical protein [Clostridiales bacterium]